MSGHATPVLHVGFAGSRLLFGPQRVPPAQAAEWEAALGHTLSQRLAALPALLGLSPAPRLCGVSQLAIGADTLFSRALKSLGQSQRVLLPQRREIFLAAGEPDQPDFTPAEQQTARELLASPHVIEVRVASQARDRIEQFEDTNAAILQESDIVVCLVREGALDRPGGTRDLMQRAERAGKPVRLLEVTMRDGQPVLSPWSTPSVHAR